ncbi:MAG: glycosyltransferase family 1 protein [Dehalococcoidia bacterium]|nr:MAG: glycosyltransferase family 1 protein [Dehalococcoidia bacterium]
MRVMQITRDYLSNGGIGRYVQELSSAMAEAGDTVAVVCASAASDVQPGVYVVPGCDEFEHPARAATRAAVVDLGSTFAPDLVLLHAMDDAGLELELRRRFRVARFVHNHVHCPSGVDYDGSSLRPCERRQGAACVAGYVGRRCWSVRKPWTAAYFQRRASAAIDNLRSAPLVFTASQYVRGRLARQGVDADRVRVAPYFAPSCGATMAPAQRPADGTTMLFVGRIVPEKGLAYLLRAMPDMRSPARLIVNGDGPDRLPMESLARKLGLGERVEFIGWTGPEGLSASYAAADVVVVPSLWPEPFGLVGIEAMAYGKPVAAFRSGAIPEWLDDGATGYAVAAGDVAELAGRLDELLGDAALRARMGCAARSRVARDYSRERHLATIRDAVAGTRWPCG